MSTVKRTAGKTATGAAHGARRNPESNRADGEADFRETCRELRTGLDRLGRAIVAFEARVAAMGGADVARRADGAADAARLPRGGEAACLQCVYILHNAYKEGRVNWKVARSVLDRKTLADWDGVPVRMFDDSGEAFGYEPNSELAFRQWVRRAIDGEAAARMARQFAEHGRSPDLLSVVAA